MNKHSNYLVVKPSLADQEIFFDENVRNCLRYFNKEISNGELIKLKGSRGKSVEICVIKERQIFFNLNDGGDVFKINELQALFCLSERNLLLLFKRGTRLYKFENYFDMLNFMSVLEVDWFVGDQNIFIHPDAVLSIENVSKVSIVVALGLEPIILRFLSLIVPGRYISDLDRHVKLSCSSRPFLYSVNYTIK